MGKVINVNICFCCFIADIAINLKCKCLFVFSANTSKYDTPCMSKLLDEQTRKNHEICCAFERPATLTLTRKRTENQLIECTGY